MTATLQKTGLVGVLLAAMLPALSCNQAAEGFNAESGSSISMGTPASATTSEDVYYLITFSVTNSLGQPANGIQVQTFCQFCEFFDRAPGEYITICDPARLQAVSQPAVFKTGDRGSYQLCVLEPAPANVGLSSYTDHITADIGVQQTSVSVTLTQQK